jgi:hypothetical protein
MSLDEEQINTIVTRIPYCIHTLIFTHAEALLDSNVALSKARLLQNCCAVERMVHELVVHFAEVMPLATTFSKRPVYLTASVPK